MEDWPGDRRQDTLATTRSVAAVLAAYAARGGLLEGAFARDDNPLLLTHIRWRGDAPRDRVIVAERHTTNDAAQDVVEREVWVRLALACAAVVPGQGLWQSMTLTARQVTELLTMLSASHANHADQAASPEDIARLDTSSMPSVARPLPADPVSPGASTRSPAPPRLTPVSPATEDLRAVSGFRSTGAPVTGSLRTGALRYGASPMAAPRTTPVHPTPLVPTSGPSYASVLPGTAEGEVTVLPSVEIAMPESMRGPGSEDYWRDFTRDIALHFAAACRAIPQVREVRGWMRGELMVLAARMAMAPGDRAPTRAEMEGATDILARALAQQTLPYARLDFAPPGEWAQGQALLSNSGPSVP